MKCKVTQGKSGQTGKRRSNKHSLSVPPLPLGCSSPKWTPSEEKKWIRNLTKHVFGDETFFRASSFALHDSFRSTGPRGRGQVSAGSIGGTGRCTFLHA